MITAKQVESHSWCKFAKLRTFALSGENGQHPFSITIDARDVDATLEMALTRFCDEPHNPIMRQDGGKYVIDRWEPEARAPKDEIKQALLQALRVE
jgi:hypothetical protein